MGKKLGGKRRGQKVQDTFYPGFRPFSSDNHKIRGLNRDFEEAQQQPIIGGRSSSSGGGGNNTTTIIQTPPADQPASPDPVTIADGATLIMGLCDATKWGSVDIHYHYSRGGREGAGHMKIWAKPSTSASAAAVFLGPQWGDLAHIAVTADIDSDILRLHMTATAETPSADLTIALCMTFTRRITP